MFNRNGKTRCEILQKAPKGHGRCGYVAERLCRPRRSDTNSNLLAVRLFLVVIIILVEFGLIDRPQNKGAVVVLLLLVRKSKKGQKGMS